MIVKRNEYLDIVKYFTIFCVIWGHVVQQTCMLDNPNYDYVYRFIYAFHMPLFMGICGYFFAKSVNKIGVVKYINNKLKYRMLGLVVPMLSFGTLKFPFLCEFDIKTYLDSIHGIWFLGDLAINTIVLLVLIRWCKGRFWEDIKYLLLGLPFASIPKLGYGGMGTFMYLFFLIGYCLASYYKEYRDLMRHWRVFLIVFVASFILFDIMPYEPSGIIKDFHNPFRMFVVFCLKFIMGVTGSYLVLFIIYKIMPMIKNNVLNKRVIERGKYTLDIYLLNIIILELIGGKLYRYYITIYDFNLFYAYGLLFEVVSTFIVSCLIMEFIIFVSKWINKNKYMAKILFYRDV